MHRSLSIAASIGTVISLAAATAFAHSGVTNPQVRERMALMTDVRDATKGLGAMLRGKEPFDADRAEALRKTLEGHAGEIPALFEPKESDPKSEARPRIWTDWDGFTEAAEAMQHAAADMETASPEALRQGMAALGKSCSACHEDYRVKK